MEEVRINVLDLSKQPEITTYGTANIRLDFELNGITPEDCTTTVYALSFFDGMSMLKVRSNTWFSSFSLNKWKMLSLS